MENYVAELGQAERSAPDLEALRGVQLTVLDKGFVRLIDWMGDDSAIVQAARISYGAGTKKVNEDRGLIRYLMRHRHTTPFEMCELKLHVRVPMDAWRQWIRHRMASVNEYSTRYSEAIDDMQRTAPNKWRLQSGSNKQGSGGYLTEWGEHPQAGVYPGSPGDYLSEIETDFQRFAQGVYGERLRLGVAREQARKDLPLSTYTEAYWKIDLHNLLHFLSLRMDSHAQEEIRAYATVIGEQIVARWCPLVWEAFQDYRLNSLTLSKPEIRILQALIIRDTPNATLALAALGDREKKELVLKCDRLGLLGAVERLRD